MIDLQLHHIGVVAANPEATTRFYQHLLGGHLERRAGHDLVVAGALRLAVSPRRPGDPEAPAWGQHLAFSAPEGQREAVLARLGALGVVWEDAQGPANRRRASEVGWAEGRTSRIYARDPDGLAVEILFE